MSNIHKPCMKKCCLNEDDICLGCFRTFNDMLMWNKASIEDKEIMLQKAGMRRKKQYVKC